MSLEQIKEIALNAQRRHIKSWMLANYAGYHRIEKWDDFRYHVSWFFTPTSLKWSDSTVRKWMRRLAESGAVEIRQSRRGGSLCYRFPREICNQMAEEAIKHWEAVGYSQIEVRPRVKRAEADGD